LSIREDNKENLTCFYFSLSALWSWDLNSEPCTFEAGVLPLESLALFVSVSEIGSLFTPGQPGRQFYLYFPYSWDDECVHHHTWLSLAEMGSSELFSCAGLEP
jgi:hypothetical protein